MTDTPATMPLHLTINGEKHCVEVDVRLLLVEAIRDVFGQRGTNIGCLTGDCGACTVIVDGRLEKSCLSLAISADGSDIQTIESLGGDELHPVQQAFREHHGFQCGYCLPGMLLCAARLLEREPEPTDSEIRHAIDGNLCRCTGYVQIVESVRQAASALAAGRDSLAPRPGDG